MGFHVLLAVFVVLFSNYATAFYDDDGEEVFNHTHPDEYYDFTSEKEHDKSVEDTQTEKEKTMKKEQPKIQETIIKEQAGYEVTENVIDIPNNESYIGPIVTNFTIVRPLNHAILKPNNVTDKEIVENDNKEDKIKPKRHYVSILHFKAEYDEKPDVNIIQNVNVNKFPNVFPAIRDYIHGVRKGIANGIHSLVNKETTHNEINNGANTPHIVAAPVLFLNTLHRKSSEVANKVHKALFRHKFQDN